MTQETRDILFGAAVLVPFLVVCYGIGRGVDAVARRRFRRALAPLAPLIDGRLGDEGRGALGGTYAGRTVWVRTSKDVRHRAMPGDPEAKRNLFEIELPQLAGRQSWHVQYGIGWGADVQRCHVGASDQALADRLTAAGAATAVERLQGWSAVYYEAGSRSLLYTEDIAPRLAPGAARFRQQLDVVAELARLNETLNAPLDASLDAP